MEESIEEGPVADAADIEEQERLVRLQQGVSVELSLSLCIEV